MVKSLESIIEGIKVVIVGLRKGTPVRFTTSECRVNSFLGAYLELVNDAKLLLAAGVGKGKVASLFFMDVHDFGGGEWVTFGEVEQGVGFLLGLVLLHV